MAWLKGSINLPKKTSQIDVVVKSCCQACGKGDLEGRPKLVHGSQGFDDGLGVARGHYR